MHRSSFVLLLCTILCALSVVVQGDYVVVSKYDTATTCNRAGLTQVNVVPVNKCIGQATGYAKAEVLGSTLTFYDCTDFACTSCTVSGDPVTLNYCSTNYDDDQNSLGMISYDISTTFPSYYPGPAGAFYSALGCKGDFSLAYIDVSDSGSACTATGTCYFNAEQGMYQTDFCGADQIPLPTVAPTSKPNKPKPELPHYDVDGDFVVLSFFENTGCTGDAENVTVMVPGVCFNYYDDLSTYFALNNNVMNQYFCTDDVCGTCVSEVVVMNSCDNENDDPTKRSEIVEMKRTLMESVGLDISYVHTELVKGFPKKLAAGKMLTVGYTEEPCQGEIEVVLMSPKPSDCAEACVTPYQTYCGVDSFLSAVPAGKSGGMSITIKIGSIIGGLIVAVAVGVIGCVIRRRLKHRHSHHHSNNSDYRPLMHGHHDDDHH